ncbi:hypothetical protein [Alcanivorax sp. 1008]|uniref:hypothetical protein n=1 Tax=Alcanivorax sp. 1008 TaxID=2816853 RepID=UPI001E0390FF|nr:hypothetical protein [Alcanivorax sp. 1008]MCC1496169.1 hypothetical protein [Alcanivorax sp. 1008]
MKFSKRIRMTSLIFLSATFISGCTVVYKGTGDVLVSYGKSELVPHLMTYRDVGMACATGESLTPLLMSFSEVGSKPDKIAPLVFVAAATCSESKALDAELRYMRAMKRGDVIEAQDARSEQKAHAEQAARRLYEAYRRTVSVYGEPAEASCPRLRSDFDELVWMVGLIAGVQSLLNDATAETAVGVPRDVAAKVERGAACLDNEKWWGVPQGTRAALWNILPMLAPQGADAWQELEKATQIGFQSGIRLASALYVISAYSVDNQPQLRKGIREFSANNRNLNEEYALLDAIAGELILGVSHRMWADATGKRTPFKSLGTFWDDAAKTSPVIDIDELL